MLKFGMIGGGLGSYIGKFHRWGAMLDDSAELVCGCFSRSMDRNRATAEAYHLPDTSRVYADFREMADKESAREDGIDFVPIMTANDTHYEITKCFLEHGIHVICNKPLALRTEEAEELARIAEERGLLFCITYSYTGYALIRQAREMIRADAIGDILHVRVQHPEDWVISSAVDGKVDISAWRFQTEKVGPSLCANDLGTHAEQMVTQFTGLHVKRVLAMLDTYPRDLPLDTNVNVLMDFGGRCNRYALGIPACDWTRVRQRHLRHRHRRLARMDRNRLRPPDLHAAQPAESAAVRRCRLSARCQHAAFPRRCRP